MPQNPLRRSVYYNSQDRWSPSKLAERTYRPELVCRDTDIGLAES